METKNVPLHQTNLFGTDLLAQLDHRDPLLRLAATIPWQEFETAFSVLHRRDLHPENCPLNGWLAAAQATGKLKG